MEDINLAVLMRKHSQEVEGLNTDKVVMKRLIQSLELSLKLKDTKMQEVVAKYQEAMLNNSKLVAALEEADHGKRVMLHDMYNLKNDIAKLTALLKDIQDTINRGQSN